MSPQEFQDLIDRYGDDLQEWPGDFLRQARELVQSCDEAQDILDQANRLRLQLMDLGVQAPNMFADHVVAVALAMDPAFSDPENPSLN